MNISSYVLKIFTPIFLIILVFIFIFKTNSDIEKKIQQFIKKVSLKKLAKYSVLIFSSIKSFISLYVISIIIFVKPIYALLSSLILFILIGFSIYKIWVISSDSQKEILLKIGYIFFGILILIFCSILLILIYNFLIYMEHLDFYIFFELVRNIKFNIIFALISLLLTQGMFFGLYNALLKIKISHEKHYSFLLQIFEFISFIPKIIYGMTCFFINEIINPNQNFYFLIILCSVFISIYYAIENIKIRFLNDFSYNLIMLQDIKDIDAKKNNIFTIFIKNFAYFIIFLGETTIVLPSIFLTKNKISFSEFYSNLLIKIYQIFEFDNNNLNVFEKDKLYILLCSFLYLSIYMIYKFFKKKYIEYI
jgi:hypothetical protein